MHYKINILNLQQHGPCNIVMMMMMMMTNFVTPPPLISLISCVKAACTALCIEETFVKRNSYLQTSLLFSGPQKFFHCPDFSSGGILSTMA